MIELWRTLIEHFVSWPIIGLILALIFKKPLIGLLDRVSSFKGPGFDLSAPLANSQLTEKTLEPPEAFRGEIIPNPSQIPPAEMTVDALAAKKLAIENYGKGIPLIDEEVETIESQLAALGMPLNSEETGHVLVRQLATTQLMLRCEKTHRLIFGSQIAAMHLMNMQGPQPESAIRPIFEAARNKEPQFYGSYSFEKWIGFLRDELAVLYNKEQYGITVYGRVYLEYIGVFAVAPKPH